MKELEETDQFIAENNGNMRDALNMVLTRLKAAEDKIENLQIKVGMLENGITEQDIADTMPDEPKVR